MKITSLPLGTERELAESVFILVNGTLHMTSVVEFSKHFYRFCYFFMYITHCELNLCNCIEIKNNQLLLGYEVLFVNFSWFINWCY